MDDLPTFRLFADPVAEGVFARTDEPCTLCGKARGWKYIISDYHIPEPDRPAICPWCIADGSAAARGMSFNESWIRPEMVRKDAPDADDIACAAIFGATPKPGLRPAGPAPELTPEDAAEVEGRTPGFFAWQSQPWHICCGRACRYLGAAGAAELRGKWAQAAEQINARWAKHTPGETMDYFIDKAERGGSPQAYVFECIICGRLHGELDMD
ncbi:MAG: CbrC family protein [Phycisphaerales bacterium JB039]